MSNQCDLPFFFPHCIAKVCLSVCERVAGFVWEYVGCVLLYLVGLLAGHERAEGERGEWPGHGNTLCVYTHTTGV